MSFTGFSGQLAACCTTCFVCAVCLLFFSGIFHSSDSQFIFAVTESLVKRGEWVTSPLWWHQNSIDTLAADGESYAKYGIGASLLAAPLYALALYAPGIGMVPAVNLTNVFVTALNAVVLYRLIAQLGYSLRRAVGLSLLWAFGTAALVYANYYFTEPQSALAFSAAFLSAHHYRIQATRKALWLVGLALSAAFLVKPVNGLFCAPLLLYVLHSVWRNERTTQTPTDTAAGGLATRMRHHRRGHL